MFDPTGPVLGIDPGLSRCGYGAVVREGSQICAVSYGVITTAPTDPIPQRLAQLAGDLEELVAELAPRSMAVERVLFQNNARTAISVGQASGLALVAAARAGIPVEQYSPNEVKLAVAGHGGADKEQVQLMVTRLLRLGAVPRPPDAADALALALCHEYSGPLRARAAAATRTDDGAPSAPVNRFDRAVAAAIARDAR
ncbi:MAG: crossover junction endodeoxyribonuclease RuvC [Acidimicrobiia bacterium]